MLLLLLPPLPLLLPPLPLLLPPPPLLLLLLLLLLPPPPLLLPPLLRLTMAASFARRWTSVTEREGHAEPLSAAVSVLP